MGKQSETANQSQHFCNKLQFQHVPVLPSVLQLHPCHSEVIFYIFPAYMRALTRITKYMHYFITVFRWDQALLFLVAPITTGHVIVIIHTATCMCLVDCWLLISQSMENPWTRGCSLVHESSCMDYPGPCLFGLPVPCPPTIYHSYSSYLP